MAKNLQLVRPLSPVVKNIDPTILKDGIEKMIEAYQHYKIVVEQEKTKREAIGAWRDRELAKIQGQKELLQQYFQSVFEERGRMIDGLFSALDKGIESNNLQLIGQSLSGIVDLAKNSPLAGLTQLLEQLDDDDCDEIII